MLSFTSHVKFHFTQINDLYYDVLTPPYKVKDPGYIFYLNFRRKLLMICRYILNYRIKFLIIMYLTRFCIIYLLITNIGHHRSKTNNDKINVK